MFIKTETTESRFWRQVDKGSDCWNWKSALTKSGYGRFSVDHKTVRAHRMAWILSHGEIPDGLLACHRCDNPRCVNPSHLFLGTVSDNVIDCIKKGRAPDRRGELHPVSKLTAAQVADIREIYSRGEISQAAIARAYGVTPSNIGCVVRGESWNK